MELPPVLCLDATIHYFLEEGHYYYRILPRYLLRSYATRLTEPYGRYLLQKMSTQRVTRTRIEPVAARLHFRAPICCPRPG
eukprot:10790603-Ditylum_brightwellii.AAC.1